ncbi:hypothetical protein F444_22669, partial [Phytophthora nicotianae P1976]
VTQSHLPRFGGEYGNTEDDEEEGLVGPRWRRQRVKHDEGPTGLADN